MEISYRIKCTVSAVSRFTIRPRIVGNLDHDGSMPSDDRRQPENPVITMDEFYRDADRDLA
jgi:hypothetical protein